MSEVETKCRNVRWEDDGVDTWVLVTSRVTRKGNFRSYVTRLLFNHVVG